MQVVYPQMKYLGSLPGDVTFFFFSFVLLQTDDPDAARCLILRVYQKGTPWSNRIVPKNMVDTCTSFGHPTGGARLLWSVDQ
jgi:hypothetical protein